MKLTLPVVALLAAMSGAPVTAAAQDYPSRPITLIVPYAAGGGNDVMARTAAEKMSKTLGQQIVIENRGGAGGSIATRQIAKAEPDGYTLGLGGTGTLAINPTLYANVGYDPRKDFAPIGLIATSALVVCVNPSLPVRSIPDLIALAKREPGKLNYASAGTGSGIHLGTEYFAAMTGIKLTHIPYKGSSPALSDLVGGHVAIYFSSLPPAVGLVKDGKVRALAVTGAKRSADFPGTADGRGSGAAGLRGGAALRDSGAGRYAAPDRRQAQRCAARRGHVRRPQVAAGTGRRRAACVDARGIRRRHRPRGDQVVGDRQDIGREGTVNLISCPGRASASIWGLSEIGTLTLKCAGRLNPTACE